MDAATRPLAPSLPISSLLLLVMGIAADYGIIGGGMRSRGGGDAGMGFTSTARGYLGRAEDMLTTDTLGAASGRAGPIHHRPDHVASTPRPLDPRPRTTTVRHRHAGAPRSTPSRARTRPAGQCDDEYPQGHPSRLRSPPVGPVRAARREPPEWRQIGAGNQQQ